MVVETAAGLAQLGLIALTQLGDVWFLFVVLIGIHWYGPDWLAGGHRGSAVVIATTVLAVGSVVTAKAAFAIPRPPGAATATLPSWLPPVLADAVVNGATADGYGFPSGHAVTSTAVYGGLAAATRGAPRGNGRTRRWRYWLAAAVIVAVVAASRVALGVHYPRDVVAGVGLGAAVLATGLWLDDVDQILGLGLVITLAGTAVAATGGGSPGLADAVGILGGCVGGSIAWRWCDPEAARVPLGHVVAGGTLVTAIWAVSMSVDGLAIVLIGSAIAVGLGVGMPTIVERRSAGDR